MINTTVQYEPVAPSGALLTSQDFEEMGRDIASDIQEGMMSQVQVTGQSYKPLAQSTLRHKSKPHEIKWAGRFAHLSNSAELRLQIGRQSELRKQKKRSKPKYTVDHPRKRLLDGGNLYENQSIKASPEGVEITINNTRAEVGWFQQNIMDTKFFGISLRAQKKILERVNRKLDQWLSRKS